MKKIFFILPIFFILFFSCQNDEDANLKQTNEKVIKSSISAEQINSIQQQLAVSMNNGLRSTGQVNEIEMRAILMPLIEDGESIRQEILSYMTLSDCSGPEIDEIRNMSETALAELSFTLAAAEMISAEFTATTTQNGSALNCLGAALGINAINDIIAGTGGLMTATKGIQIIKSFGLRYLGYIGLAIAIVQFVECVS